jgi:hypothetical protein
MALQRMILVPRELWENRCQTSSPQPVKKILKSKDDNYDKWTRFRLHQDPYLKTEKQKRQPIPIPITETQVTDRKSVPEWKIDSLPVHSKYIHNVLRRKLSHDPTFGVYRNYTDGSFKIGRSRFEYNKHVFVDGTMYKEREGFWELLSKSKPEKNLVTLQDRQT